MNILVDPATGQPPRWFKEAVTRAVRIDAFNRIRTDIEADDTPILLSVFDDFAYGRPPFDSALTD